MGELSQLVTESIRNYFEDEDVSVLIINWNFLLTSRVK